MLKCSKTRTEKHLDLAYITQSDVAIMSGVPKMGSNGLKWDISSSRKAGFWNTWKKDQAEEYGIKRSEMYVRAWPFKAKGKNGKITSKFDR